MSADWCHAIDPDGRYMCDRPKGHEGDHHGFEMPTFILDEPWESA